MIIEGWVKCAAALAVVALAACAKPAVEQHGSTSAGPANSGGAEVSDAPTRAPVNTCEASAPREVRYGKTVGPGVKLRPELAGLRCIEDAHEALADDIACANEFNRASWTHAYAQTGLRPLEMRPAGRPIGVAPQLGEIYRDPEDEDRALVFLGYESGGDCSGQSTHTVVAPPIALAANGQDQVVVVIPRPTVEGRSYVRCSCFPGCGAMFEAQPLYAALDASVDFAGSVELVYPAISIVTNAAESESCCCAP